MQPNCALAHSALRVLIADDNRDAADTLACLVRLWGHTPHVVYGGHAAQEAAVEFLPRVVLLDIGMPMLDGFSVARWLRGHSTLAQPVIAAITAYSDAETRQRAHTAGFDHLFVKPVDPVKLQQFLAQSALPTG